jgi:hypothetical protein
MSSKAGEAPFTRKGATVFTCVRSLLTRPGQLTTDFLAGKRKTQAGPAQMFIVC